MKQRDVDGSQRMIQKVASKGRVFSIERRGQEFLKRRMCVVGDDDDRRLTTIEYCKEGNKRPDYKDR